jgi:hypothetical protein
MKRRFAGSLALSLGLLAGQAWAEDLQWRPAAQSAAPAVSASRPTALGNHATGNDSLPTVSLARPVPLEGDRQVRPASYQGESASDQPRFVVRGKVEDPLQPMPIGHPTKVGPPANDLSFMGPNSQPVAVPSASDLGTGFGIEGYAPCGPDACGPTICCPTDCCCTGPCAKPHCFWVSAEVLGWGIKDSNLPPLVTASAAGTPLGMAGVLGPGTGILFGGHDLNNEEFAGGRFGVGFWLDKCQTLALEGNFLFLGSRTNGFVAGSAGDPILARPFFDTRGFENAQLVAFPGLITGGVNVASTSSLWGAEANLRWHALEGPFFGLTYRTDFLAGFRYLELDEKLGITESLLVPAGAATPRAVGPAGILVLDQFKTWNQFYGGQVGADTEFGYGRWFLGLNGKVALGTLHQVVDINGSTTFSQPGVNPSTVQGGLLAQPTNIGRFSRDRLAVLPEFGLKLGYQFNDHLRVFVGYNLLYINNVVRPGDQIDRTINITQIPNVTSPPSGEPVRGTPRPLFTFRSTDFWAQGVNCGLEFRY